MEFNYSKLSGRIVEVCGTQGRFAARMGVSERTISLKMNSKVMFRQDEIMKAVRILGLTTAEIAEYFFLLAFRAYKGDGENKKADL